MSKLSYQYDILNLTPANAQPVEANFTKVEQHINAELIERDGSIAMRQPLKLAGDPVAALDAAPKQYVDQVLPIGIIMLWGAAAPPSNGRWLLCDGAPLQTATWPELFAVIGYAWGGSGGSFNAPPLSGKFPLGVSGTHALGQTGGSEDAIIPSHLHGVPHDHGSTGIESANHAHTAPDHLHAVSLTTSANGAHNHSVPLASSNGFLVNGLGVDPVIDYQVGGTTAFGYTPFTTTQTDHQHSLNGSTGSADRALNTGGVNTNHSHVVGSFNGNTAAAGEAPAGKNMPPFLAIPYIIRAR